jgi:transcriptional regulator with XRE-family HTH domain
MGERLRAARRARGLSLRELAKQLDVSPSLISQVETGRASPSVSTLYAIAQVLSVSVDDLLFDEADRPQRTPPVRAATTPDQPAIPVQRGTDRIKIRLASGVTWERLTTESVPGIDFLYVIYEVGGASSPEHEFQRHLGREWGFVVSGRLGVTIGFEDHLLEPGDSIAVDSTIPHRLYTVGDEPVHAIWFVLGRRAMVDDGGRPPAV